MGNCQTADVAAVMIQHPDGRLERACWSLTASDVMAANPGHYVAVVSVVVVASRRPDSGASSGDDRGGTRSSDKAVRYLKLLRPDEPLLVGNFYRLVSFEDVLREFGSKRRVRLSKLLAKEEERRRRLKVKEALGIGDGNGDDDGGNNTFSSELVEEEDEKVEQRLGSAGDGGTGGGAIRMPRHLPWRPTLQTISEVGTSSFH